MHRPPVVLAATSPRLIPQEDLIAVIEAVLRIVTRAWIQIRRQGLLTNEHRQSEILAAGLLYQYMLDVEQKRQPRTPPMKIKSEAATFSTSGQLVPDGRIDIEIIYSLADDPDLRIECKRISTTEVDDPKAKARYYVRGGVLRFVSDQYGWGQSWGVLIAFVIDGLFQPAVDLVKKYVKNYQNAPSHLMEDWGPAGGFVPLRHIFSTKHRQGNGRRTIRLLHLFLPFPRR